MAYSIAVQYFQETEGNGPDRGKKKKKEKRKKRKEILCLLLFYYAINIC